MAYELDQEILRAVETKSPNEDENLEVIRAVLRKKHGTKDQRNALLRIIKQVSPLVVDRDARSGIKKAITKIGTDFKLPDLA